MESSVVINTANSYCLFIKSYFNNKISKFVLESEYSYSPYWDVVFVNKDVKIHIFGDVGFTIDIVLFGTKYNLSSYDRSVIKKMKTSEENILYQLDVLKRFLTEVGC